MTLLRACEWLDSSWIGTVIRNSKWGFALIEMVHLLALALLGSTLLVSALQSLGLIFKESPPGAISRDLGRARNASLAAMIVSGLLLFADGPLRYYGNAAFRAKLLLIGGAALTGVLSHCIGSGSTRRKWPAAAKAATLLSLTLWLGAGVAGRVIGVL
jgi:hypothetical protein